MGEEQKKRLTMHNGRKGSKGVYSPKHNDRNFDTTNDEHIHDEKTVDNYTWHCYKSVDPSMSFEEAEKRFYNEHFTEHINHRNKREIETGHFRVKTMDDYRGSRQTCPEETIFQIGKMGDDDVDKEAMLEAVQDFVLWEKRTFPNVHTLDLAMHTDEDGQAHVHQRKVWIAHEDGREIVAQRKALLEMGIKRPNEAKKRTSHNNEKMTYTRICRDKLIEICKQRGFDIELEPLEASKTGLTLLEYKRREEERKAKEAKEECEKLKAEKEALESKISENKEKIDKLDKDWITYNDNVNERIEVWEDYGDLIAEQTKTKSDLEAQIANFNKKRDIAKAEAEKAEETLKKRRDEILKQAREQAERETEALMQQCRVNMANKQAEKEREFQAREDKLEAQKKALAERENAVGKRETAVKTMETDVATKEASVKQFIKDADESARKTYNNLYEKAFQQYGEITNRKSYFDYQKIIRAAAASRIKYKGKQLLQMLKELAGVDLEIPFEAPPKPNPPKFRSLPAVSEAMEKAERESSGLEY